MKKIIILLLMNLIISAIFVCLALILLARPLVVLLMTWVIDRPSLKKQVVAIFVFGVGIMVYAISVSQWFYYTGALALFIVGLLACTWMIALVKKSQLKYFSFYCFVVGIIAITHAAI